MWKNDFATEHFRSDGRSRVGWQRGGFVPLCILAQYRDGFGYFGDYLSAGLLVALDAAIACVSKYQTGKHRENRGIYTTRSGKQEREEATG